MLIPISSVFHIFLIGTGGAVWQGSLTINPTPTGDLPRLRLDFFTKMADVKKLEKTKR